MQGRKRQFIFGLIGLGCGMVLSGIFNLLIVLNTTEYKNGITLNANQVLQEELKPENMQLEKETSIEVAGPIDLLTKPNETSSSQKETQFKEDENVINSQKADNLLENVEDEESVITVIIPEKQSATQICELLEAEGVIKDAKSFREYLSEKKMTTKLKEGTIILRKNMSYDELLDNLMID